MSQNNEMTVFIKSKDLIDYTFVMTDSLKRFSKKMRFTFVNRMQNLSLDIYTKLLKTNEIPVRQRQPVQIDILGDINVLLFLIELSFNKSCLDEKQCSLWTRKALDVKYLTAAWLNRSK